MTLPGAGTVRPRTAELRDVFSDTAFSSQRLVKVAVFMLLKRHQHIQVQSWLNKILSDLAKLLLVPAWPLTSLLAPSRYSCTFGQRERLVFVRVLGLCCVPANLMNAGQVIGGETKRTCNILVWYLSVRTWRQSNHASSFHLPPPSQFVLTTVLCKMRVRSKGNLYRIYSLSSSANSRAFQGFSWTRM